MEILMFIAIVLLSIGLIYLSRKLHFLIETMVPLQMITCELDEKVQKLEKSNKKPKKVNKEDSV